LARQSDLPGPWPPGRSNDPADQYFVDRLTEEMADSFSHFKNVHVVRFQPTLTDISWTMVQKDN
jgi:TolB-like protein